MKISTMSLALLCVTPGIISCSSPALAPSEAMRIEPVMQVTHSDNTASGLYQLGRYYQGQSRLQLAEQAYRKALALNVDFVKAHSALGTVYAQQGKFEEAISEFDSVLRTAPQLAQIYNNLGYTYYLQGNHEAAVAALRKATLLEPGNARAFNNLGAAYEKLGQVGEAQSAFARAAELSTPTPRVAAAQELMRADARVPLPALTAGPAIDLASTAQTRTPAGLSPSVEDASMSLAGKPFRFQIANGNGTPALARRFRDALVNNGLPKPRLANLKPYQQKLTVIQYRAGFRDEALRVSAHFASPPAIARAKLPLQGGIDVRLILGRDVASQAALLKTQKSTTSSGEQTRGHPSQS